MPTNNIKHQMLKLAKKIAEKEFSATIEEIQYEENSLVLKIVISAEMHREREIDSILEEHPEFDEHEFVKMIRNYQVKLAQIKEENGL